MGTNFYMNEKHLGKRSGVGNGKTTFLWAGTEALSSPNKITKWILSAKGKIVDEYGTEISKDKFLKEVITDEYGLTSLRVSFAKDFC
jgi:hypothetical protein